MKKVFLLATTAVFMTTANAMAADPVTVSMTALAVQAELTPLAAFTKNKELNFGGIVFNPSDFSGAGANDYVSFGEILEDSDTPNYTSVVKAHYGTPSRGKYTYTGSLNFNGGTFTIGDQACTLSGGSIGSCGFTTIALGENARLDYVLVQCTATPKECYFGGLLKVKKSYLESLESTGKIDQSLTITYNY